jgi:hypothetical protein
MHSRLFTLANPKTRKGEAKKYLTIILHLAPAWSANTGINVCPRSTEACRRECLYFAGRGIMPKTQAARIRRTREFVADREGFTRQLVAEVMYYRARARRKGMRLAVRINGTSDLPALSRAVAREVPGDVTFYDYTKIPGAWTGTERIRYTFSRSEENEIECARALSVGVNVAVVFDTPKGLPLPARYTLRGKTYSVIDGDAHDLRFLDPPTGIIVGLRAKGRARRGVGGFVMQAAA